MLHFIYDGPFVSHRKMHMNWHYDDFQKAWTLSHSLEIALPYCSQSGNYWENTVKNHSAGKIKPSVYFKFTGGKVIGRNILQLQEDLTRHWMIYNEMISSDSLDPETYYEKAMLLEQLKRYITGHQSTSKGLFISGGGHLWTGTCAFIC